MKEKLTNSIGKKQIINIVGEKFGKALVLSYNRINKRREATFECLCDCGTKFITSGILLRKGGTKSCGCLQKQLSKVMGKRFGGQNKKEDTSFNQLFKHYRRCSKKRGYDFELTKEQFKELTKKECYYCGKIPSQEYKSHNSMKPYMFNGIDRVNNLKGYTLENCVSCCGYCNLAKRAMTQDDFFSIVKNIYEKHNLKDFMGTTQTNDERVYEG